SMAELHAARVLHKFLVAAGIANPQARHSFSVRCGLPYGRMAHVLRAKGEPDKAYPLPYRPRINAAIGVVGDRTTNRRAKMNVAIGLAAVVLVTSARIAHGQEAQEG